jgi:Tfp pilus assembly protein PilO
VKNKSSLGLILFIVAAIGWFVVVRGQIKTFSQNALTAEVKSKELRSYQDRQNHVKTIVDKGGSDATTRLNAFFLALPKQSQIPEVLVMIEQMASSSGVVFNSATVGSPTAEEVPVSISFGGSLSSVNSFLDTLYTNVRTVKIKNQVINADKTGKLSVTMQIGLVYQGK